jgi:hypothetical protein
MKTRTKKVLKIIFILIFLLSIGYAVCMWMAVSVLSEFGDTIYCREHNMLLWHKESDILKEEIEEINKKTFEECMTG